MESDKIDDLMRKLEENKVQLEKDRISLSMTR